MSKKRSNYRIIHIITSILKRMASSNEVSIAIENQEWLKAETLIREFPSLATVWKKRDGLFDGAKTSHCLPLHELCLATAPVSTITAFINAYPDGIRTKESSYARLPLHCACKRVCADPKVVASLVAAHKAGCLIPDNLGRLPIHYALSNGADATIIYLILSSQPDSAKGVDMDGWTPLHVACSVGNKGAIVALLHIYPEAAFSRTKNGSTPAMCLNKSIEDRKEIKKMLKAACQRFDTTFINPLTTRRNSLVAETDSVLV